MSIDDLVDPRGPRTAAAVTSVVLGVALVGIGSWVFPALVIVQTIVFLVGAVFGIARQPYVAFYRLAISPRLSQPVRWQQPKAPRMAQAIGALLLVAGLIAWFAAALPLAATFVAAAWVVATTLALTGFCVGCEGYDVWKALRESEASPR